VFARPIAVGRDRCQRSQSHIPVEP
jgi:hypothetical protein